MNRRWILILVAMTLIPVYRIHAADPIVAHVLMMPSTNLDPVSLPKADLSGRDLVENLFVGLTRYDPVSGQIQPAAARDWSVSPDGMTWTFNLRNDIQWVTFDPTSQQVTAVRPVVAGDFLYGIRRACNPTPPNPAAHTIYIIDGCRRIATANPQFLDDITITRELNVQVINDQTLQITLAFPAPYFTTLLALPEFRAVPREAIAKDADWTKFGVIISDGPWVMAASTPDQAMTLVRNPLWPMPWTGNVDRIEVSFVPTTYGVGQQFTAGGIDFARLDIQTAQPVKAAMPDNVMVGPGIDSQITVLGFSTEQAGVYNESFRRALATAINRDSLVQQIYPGVAVSMSQMIPPDVIGAPPDAPDNRAFSPDVATVSLGASGLGSCKVPEKLDFAVEDAPQPLAVAQELITQWQTVLGCQPTSFTIHKAPADYVQDVAHANVDTQSASRPHLWLYAWSGDYPDANAWIADSIHCLYGYMRTGLSCSNAESLIDTAALETDPAKRIDDYQQAEAILFGPGGKFPVAPLYISLTAIGHSSRLSGFSLNGNARFDLWVMK